jgi:hypothetical protein
MYREEHINKKIEQVITEAKAKLAKGDKKGTLLPNVIGFGMLFIYTYRLLEKSNSMLLCVPFRIP